MQNDAVIQQVLDRTEKRIEQFGIVDKPTLKVIAAPVCLDRPMIQPIEIYNLYKTWAGVKKVAGGVCVFTEPSDDAPDQSMHDYFELNEYGVVYYRMPLYENRGVPYFINNIHSLLEHATELYNACDASVDIRIHASVNNVFKEVLSRDLGRWRPISPSKLMCYDSQVCVSTTDTYPSTDFDNIEYQRAILAELTSAFLWAFNVPMGNDTLVKYIKELIG